MTDSCCSFPVQCRFSASLIIPRRGNRYFVVLSSSFFFRLLLKIKLVGGELLQRPSRNQAQEKGALQLKNALSSTKGNDRENIRNLRVSKIQK
jgi:hypothetical protein